MRHKAFCNGGVIAVILAAAFFPIVSCGGMPADSSVVENRLIGVWETISLDVWPPGTDTPARRGQLVITRETIKISGPPPAPLQNITQETTLEAYTEDNQLYIKDQGVWQTPVTYRYWLSADPSPENKRLTVGGDSSKTLKWSED
ncbi:MAG: hypothetical protein LBG84_02550 [Treponema sp.]|jgi:hypothetical protein|nr:hypothetical protein [Treponema sp.]